MAEFTYIIPNEKAFLNAVIQMLPIRGLEDLTSVFQNAQCEIRVSPSFSHVRWNAYYTTVDFRVPIAKYYLTDLQDENLLNTITAICDELMPKNAGYDVMEVTISPLINLEEDNSSLTTDLEGIVSTLTSVDKYVSLPEDIMKTGQQTAEAYIYLYIVENFLRLFIEKVLTDKFGLSYLLSVTVSKSILSGVELRKNQEKKNMWLSIRGNSDLFYFDFKDLGNLIQSNWEIFKNYFPDQAWICTKIEEMGNCRNLVAHNSVIGDHERNLIKLYFRSITKQLSDFL